MIVNNPQYVWKIASYYIKKIDNLQKSHEIKNFDLQDEEKTRIKTDFGESFLNEGVATATKLVEVLNQKLDYIKFNEEPDGLREFLCIALQNYLKDLETDRNTIVKQVGLTSQYLKGLDDEISRAKSYLPSLCGPSEE